MRPFTVSQAAHQGKGRSTDPPKNSRGVAPEPFAALPHALRRDPRLVAYPRAIVLAAALLEFARSKASCWPCNRRLADDLACSPRTIQNALAALRDAGWIRIEHGPDGRVIVLVWREASCTPPTKPIAVGGVKPVASELENQRERDRPVGSGGESPPNPGEGETGDAVTAADIELWTAWATGPDERLATFGRCALATVGRAVDPPGETTPVPTVCQPAVAPIGEISTHRDFSPMGEMEPIPPVLPGPPSVDPVIEPVAAACSAERPARQPPAIEDRGGSSLGASMNRSKMGGGPRAAKVPTWDYANPRSWSGPRTLAECLQMPLAVPRGGSG